jgi:hypothetical protein
MRTLPLLLLLLVSAWLWAAEPAQARSAGEIIEFAATTAGGDAWRYAETNVMSGHATLCRDGDPDTCVHSDDYVMYRLYPTEITDVHSGTGKFRLDALRGFHRRIYTEYYWIDDPGFMQPGRVRLYYDGIRTSDIYWTQASINVPLDDALFTLDE